MTPGRPSIMVRLGPDGCARVLRDLLGAGPGATMRCIAPTEHRRGDLNPSMQVGRAGVTCHGCGLRLGLLDLVAKVQRLTSRAEAARHVEQHYLGNGHAPAGLPAEPDRSDAERRAHALDCWHEARPDSGRLAQYLTHRGLSGRVPESLRLHPSLPYFEDGIRIAEFEAMLAPLATLSGEIVAVHRTYLAPDCPGKAAVPKPKKLTPAVRPGATRGAAIHLAEPADRLAVAEGIETALAVMEATGTPTWAAGSAGGLEAVEVPPTVKLVQVWADQDDGNGRGQEAAAALAKRLTRGMKEVRVLLPPTRGSDWLDVLVASGPEALRSAVAEAKQWSQPEGSVAEPAGRDEQAARTTPPAAGRDNAAERLVPQWPAPPAQEVFHGLVGEVVNVFNPVTEADPVAVALDFIVSFGNLLGAGPAGPHASADGAIHSANEFVLFVGRTAKGRKGTARARTRQLLAQIPGAEAWLRDCSASGLSSGEGVIYAVRDRVERRNKKGEMVVEDDGVSDKRLVVYEDEFASALKVMAREGNTLSPILRRAWDGGTLRTMTRNSPLRATGPHVSVEGHVGLRELRRLLTETDVTSGFANRFLIVCVRRSKLLPDGGDPGREAMAGIAAKVGGALSRAATVGRMGRDEAASSLWRDVYPHLSAEVPGLLGAAIARAEAHVLRLSLAYALLDGSATVRVEHLRAALAAWDYCRRSAEFVFGGALGDKTADAILGALRDATDGLTRTEISGALGRNVQAGEIERALGALVENGLAASRVEGGAGGRPAERWFSLDISTKETKEVHPRPAEGGYFVSFVGSAHEREPREEG